MGIGASIFLLAAGAILAFAVNSSLGFLDLNVVGWVLMLAGVLGLILTMWFWQNRRRVAATPIDHETVEEYREVRRAEPPL